MAMATTKKTGSDSKARSNMRVVKSDDPATAETQTPTPASKYSADDFLIPAHDEHGHSIPYSFRADKRFKAAISAMIWSRKWPFRTDGDLHRWCLLYGMRALEAMEPGTIRSHILEIDSINDQIVAVAKAMEFVESIKTLEEQVQKLINMKLRGMAVRMVYEIRKRARLVTEPLMRNYMLEEIQTRFGHLFQNVGPTVALTNIDEESSSAEEEQMHASWGYSPGEIEIVDPVIDEDEE